MLKDEIEKKSIKKRHEKNFSQLAKPVTQVMRLK